MDSAILADRTRRVFSSYEVAVIEEIKQGDFPNKQDVIDLAAALPIVPIDENIGETWDI